MADADTVADVKEDQLEAAPVVDKPAASLVDKPAASWVHHRNLEGQNLYLLFSLFVIRFIVTTET